MKKLLIIFGLNIAIIFGSQITYAECPCSPLSPCISQTTQCCNQCNPCEKTNPCLCQTCFDPCCEGWLDCQKLENYFCKLGLTECQKIDARNVIARFICETQNLRCKGYKCENKCECRKYRKEICNLDYEMKKIITDCQKQDYNCIRSEIKDQVKCCHNCLIWPFSFGGCCKCNCCCN